MAETKLTEGMALYSISTGRIAIFNKNSRKAVELMSTQDGFVGITPYGDCTLFFYDSENNAKIARNVAQAKGVVCGNNIARFVVQADGVPAFDAEYAKANGLAGVRNGQIN